MGNIIKNGGTLVVASMLLGGCGLPVGVTIASWAADGISYVATDKTLTEHGISAVAGKDCSVWRMFKGGNFCVEWKDGEKPTIVAQNDQGQVDELGFDYDGDDTAYIDAIHSEPQVAEAKPKIESYSQNIKDVENELPKSQPITDSAQPDQIVISNEKIDAPAITPFPVHYATPLKPVSVKAQASVEPVSATKIKAVVAKPAKKAVSAPNVVSKNPASAESANRYFVIGSYFGPDYAKRHAERHALLGASVAKAKVGRKDVYRVIVGPFTKAEQPAIHKLIKRSKIRQAWITSMAAPNHLGSAQLDLMLEAYQDEPGLIQVAGTPSR
jgi:cell division protein FtsN